MLITMFLLNSTYVITYYVIIRFVLGNYYNILGIAIGSRKFFKTFFKSWSSFMHERFDRLFSGKSLKGLVNDEVGRLFKNSSYAFGSKMIKFCHSNYCFFYAATKSMLPEKNTHSLT